MRREPTFLGWLMLGALAAALFAGCGETTEPRSEAPALPPAQSMALDLDFFGDGSAPGVTDLAGTKLNFLNAAVRVAFLNVAVVTVLTPPTLAFEAAVHTLPSRQDDGSYMWIYTWVDHGLDHQIRLRGMPENDHVDWELNVVLPGAEPELWFSGRSYVNRNEGYWVFRDFTLAGDPEVIRIDWEVNAVDDAFLDITNIYVGHDEEGDELAYRMDGVMRSVEFHDASAGDDWDITWDESDGSGSLRVPDYNDGERACWDADRDDVDCSAAAPGLSASDELR